MIDVMYGRVYKEDTALGDDLLMPTETWGLGTVKCQAFKDIND